MSKENQELQGIEENEPWWGSPLTWFIGVIAFSVLLKVFVLGSYAIPSSSMENTIVPGQRVFTLTFLTPERGEIGTFTPSNWSKPEETFIKRVIGAPGDTLGGCSPDGKLMLNGEPLNEPYLKDPHISGCNFPQVTLGDNQYWMMGDNRNGSADSREHAQSENGGFDVNYGAVMKNDFTGKYWFTFWNPNWI